MFNWLKKAPTPEPVSLAMRDTLFGDQPLSEWPPQGSPAAQGQPWTCFINARRALSEGNTNEAVRQ